MNQIERLAALTNKDDHKDNYTEIFEKLVKERLDEIKKLIDETNQNDSTYYLKDNTARKRFNDFNNDIELKKIQSGEMKLEKAKKLQCIKSNLNVIQEVEDINQNSKK